MFLAALVLAFALLPSVAGATQDQPPINRVIERLQEHRPAIGTFTRTGRPDLDFVVLDAQYGEFDLDALREALDGLRVSGAPPATAPIVRIPSAARDAPELVVGQLLDLGVLGVMFPNIETPEQAAAAVSSMRYAQAPVGSNTEPSGRRTSGSGSAPDYWSLGDDDYRARADVWPLNSVGQLIAMLQIESRAGIEQLDEILTVPGIGAVFLGPTDLAESIGADGPSSLEVEALVQQVLMACQARDIPCGYPVVAATRAETDRQTARRLREGFTVLAVMTTGR